MAQNAVDNNYLTAHRMDEFKRGKISESEAKETYESLKKELLRQCEGSQMNQQCVVAVRNTRKFVENPDAIKYFPDEVKDATITIAKFKSVPDERDFSYSSLLPTKEDVQQFVDGVTGKGLPESGKTSDYFIGVWKGAVGAAKDAQSTGVEYTLPPDTLPYNTNPWLAENPYEIVNKEELWGQYIFTAGTFATAKGAPVVKTKIGQYKQRIYIKGNIDKTRDGINASNFKTHATHEKLLQQTRETAPNANIANSKVAVGDKILDENFSNFTPVELKEVGINSPKVTNFPGVKFDSNTKKIIIKDTDLYIENLKKLYEIRGNDLTPKVELQIRAHIKNNNKIFDTHAGLPGAHAEVQAYNYVIRTNPNVKASDITIATTRGTMEGKITSATGTSFPACTNCQGIIHKDVNIPTGIK